jgi:hypothetical protein
MDNPETHTTLDTQETEITAYLVSAIDNNMAIDDADFGD